MRFFISVVFLLSVSAFAGQVNKVTVSGDKEAKINLDTTDDVGTPSLKVNENVVELVFANAKLDELSGDPKSIASPHPLLQTVSMIGSERSTKVRIVLNGTVENLKNRLNLAKSPKGYTLSVAYPASESAALNLLKEEQLPIGNAVNAAKTVEARSSSYQMVILVLVLALLAAAAFFFLRFVKRQNMGKGSRKFLIEQLSYCGVGPKAGVSLLKIGNEFVLVGVTGSSVTLLSGLPKLQQQYEEDSRFERGVFKEAVEEEFDRVKRRAPLSS